MHCTSSCHTPWTRCCYPHLTDEETKHKRFDNLQKDHKCHSWGSNLDLPGSFGHSTIRREEWCVSFQEALVEACIPFYLLLSFKSWLPVQELRVLPAFDIFVLTEGSKAKEPYGILWGGWSKTWDADLGVSPGGPLDAVTPPSSPMTQAAVTVTSFSNPFVSYTVGGRETNYFDVQRKPWGWILSWKDN